MSCYRPRECWRSRDLNWKGNRPMVFNPIYALEPDNPVKISCGYCIGCRLRRSAAWAVRCVHEAQMWQENCFVTITFSDEGLARRSLEYRLDGLDCDPASIYVRDCQLFMKRLRRRMEYEYGLTNIRMVYCGEYGDRNLRPHYHFLLFNFDFWDRIPWNVVNGHQYFRSAELEKVWPYGFSVVGDVSFESAAYVARYCLKKQFGKDAWRTYVDFDELTGEVYSERVPEFFNMSRRSGIGLEWLRKFYGDVYPSDEVVLNGRRLSAPKYYDTKFGEWFPSMMEDVKFDRFLASRKAKVLANCTTDRLRVRETVKLRQISKLKRGFEDGSSGLSDF